MYSLQFANKTVQTYEDEVEARKALALAIELHRIIGSALSAPVIVYVKPPLNGWYPDAADDFAICYMRDTRKGVEEIGSRTSSKAVQYARMKAKCSLAEAYNWIKANYYGSSEF
jgi:hypothetical protein